MLGDKKRELTEKDLYPGQLIIYHTERYGIIVHLLMKDSFFYAHIRTGFQFRKVAVSLTEIQFYKHRGIRVTHFTPHEERLAHED